MLHQKRFYLLKAVHFIFFPKRAGFTPPDVLVINRTL